MTLVGGSVFAGPGVMDRAVRQTRVGAFRSVGGMRPGEIALDDRVTADEIVKRSPPDALRVLDRPNVSAPERRLSRVMADVSSAGISPLSPQPGGNVPSFRSVFAATERIAFPGSRGPPTL